MFGLAGRVMMAAAAQGALDLANLPDATRIAHYRADDYTAGNWPDRSGNGYTLTQGTAGNQPAAVADGGSGFANKPVVRFTAANSHFLENALLSQAQPFTWIVIGKGGDVSQVFVDGGSSTTRALLTFTASGNLAMFGGTVLEGTSGVDTPLPAEAFYNGASSVLRGNSAVEASGDAGTQTLTGVKVGCRWDEAQFLDGDIAEIILVDGELTEADRVYLALYCAQRYGFAIPFPQVLSVTESTFASGTTTHDVAMPATVAAGELLLLFMSKEHSSTSLFDQSQDWTLIDAGLLSQLAIYYKIADGTEGGTTYNFSTAGATAVAAQVYRVGLWGGTPAMIASSTYASGTSAAPNPNAVTPSGGDKFYSLFIAACGCEDDGSVVTAAPASFSDLIGTESGATANQQTSLGTARRTTRTSSENAGAFTIAASQVWTAATVAVRALAGAGG